MSRAPQPIRAVLCVALAVVGAALVAIALYLLTVTAYAVFGNYDGLQNDPCSVPPEGLSPTIHHALAGAGAAVALIVAIGLARRSSAGHRRARLPGAVAAVLVAAALVVSLSFMLDPAVEDGPCSQRSLDRAQWLLGVTGTMAAVATLLAGIWLMRAAVGSARRWLLRFALAIAASAPLWASAWWMYNALLSND